MIPRIGIRFMWTVSQLGGSSNYEFAARSANVNENKFAVPCALDPQDPRHVHALSLLRGPPCEGRQPAQGERVISWFRIGFAMYPSLVLFGSFDPKNGLKR